MTEFYPGVVAVLRALTTNRWLPAAEIAPNLARREVASTLTALAEVFGLVQQQDAHYRLLYPLQWLAATRLAMALDTTVHKVDEIASTCDWARTADGAGFFFAEHQTAGRGRRGRQWLAMPAASLLVAARLPRPSQLEGLSLAVGVALWRALDGAGRIFVKWPNDLLTSTKQKIGGVLIEATQDFVIVGVGLNLLMTPQLQTYIGRPLAGLNDILPKPWSRHDIAVRVAQSIQRAVETFAINGIAPFLTDALAAHMVRPGHDFSLTIEDKIKHGVFMGFDDRGALLMRQNGHLHHYWGGEIA